MASGVLQQVGRSTWIEAVLGAVIIIISALGTMAPAPQAESAN